MVVLTANAFASGEVLYHVNGGWTDDLQLATIFTDRDDAAPSQAQAESLTDKLVGVYLIEVEVLESAIKPIQYREVIRASGPTNYRHGKTAEGVKGYVSL